MQWAVEGGYDDSWRIDDIHPESDALKDLRIADELSGFNGGYLPCGMPWAEGLEYRMNRQMAQKTDRTYTELLHGLIRIAQAIFAARLNPTRKINVAGLRIQKNSIRSNVIEYIQRIAVRIGLPCFIRRKSHVIHTMKKNDGQGLAAEEKNRCFIPTE